MVFEERCFFLDFYNDFGRFIFIENLVIIVINIICLVIVIMGNGIILVIFLKINYL